jgi:hypothetical protein
MQPAPLHQGGGGRGGHRGGGRGRGNQSESERVALRLADNYWDLEGLALALGSGSGGGGGGGGSGVWGSSGGVSPETARRHDAKQVRVMMSAIEGTGPGFWSGRYKIEHPYKGRLHSCYASLCNGNEPAMTSCHGKFTGTVDYLWLSDGLAARRVLLPPAAPSGKLPSEEHPSDHVSIVTDVAFAQY